MKTVLGYMMILACLIISMPVSVLAQEEPEDTVIDLSVNPSALEDGATYTNLTLKNGVENLSSVYDYDNNKYSDNEFYYNGVYFNISEGGTLKLVNWGTSEKWDYLYISSANKIHFKTEDCYAWVEVTSANPSSLHFKGGEIGLYGDDFLRTEGDRNTGHVTALESFIVETSYFNCRYLYLYDQTTNEWWHNMGRVFDKLHTIKIISDDPDGYCNLTSAMFDGCYKVTTLDLNHAGLTWIPDLCFRYYTATEITLPPSLWGVGVYSFGRDSYTGDSKDISTGVWYYTDDNNKLHKKTDANGKQIHIADFPSAYSVKYWDADKGDYVFGFPETLEYLDCNSQHKNHLFFAKLNRQ